MKKFKMSIYGIMLTILLSTFCGIMQNKPLLLAESQIITTAKSALLIDYNSGTIIFEKEKDKKLPIASMVK